MNETHEIAVPEQIPVIIVGGGLSGLVLSREYARRGIDHIVLEASPLGKNQSIHYLTSRKTAESLGLSEKYEKELSARNSITGYALYDGKDEGLTPLESLSPGGKNRDGLVTFSIEQIRDWLMEEDLPVRRGQSVNGVERLESNNLLVSTTKGQLYETQLVVDATGARTKILQMTKTVDSNLISNRFVRYCYGAVFSYDGPEDKLLFIDRFPAHKNIPQERAGWVMPLGGNKAEVVVAWEGALGDLPNWHTAKLKDLLSSYIEWFRQRGININPSSETEVVSGIYSEGLLDYRKLPATEGIVAFGESAGLNHPVNGYLIGTIAGYAKIMAEETEKYLSTHNWNPYERLIAESSVNYGLQKTLVDRKIRAGRFRGGRFKVTKRQQNFLVASLGEDGFWNAIDNEIPLGKIITGLMRHPQYIDQAIRIGGRYLLSLFKYDNLYLAELGLKLKAKLKKR